jgi:hypothetical protein
MSGGWKGHIGPDFGDDGLDRNPTEPWHFVQSFDDIAKGRERPPGSVPVAAFLSFDSGVGNACCGTAKSLNRTNA